MNTQLQKNSIVFVAGMLTMVLLYLLFIKPSDEPLPTVFEQAESEQQLKIEESKIETSDKNLKTIYEKYQKVTPANIDTKHKRDSLRKSAIRKGNQRRRAKGLDTL